MKNLFTLALAAALFSAPQLSYAFQTDEYFVTNVENWQAPWTKQLNDTGKVCLVNWDKHSQEYALFVAELTGLSQRAQKVISDVRLAMPADDTASLPSLRAGIACGSEGKQLSVVIGTRLKAISEGMSSLELLTTQHRQLVDRARLQMSVEAAKDFRRSWKCLRESSYTDLAQAAVTDFLGDGNSYGYELRSSPNGFRMFFKSLDQDYSELYSQNENLVDYATKLSALQAYCPKN